MLGRLLLLVGLAALLGACSSSRPLPPYEPPLAHTGAQSVRTTAYTHTEADHVEYGNRNALGGTLHAAPLLQPVLAPSPLPALTARPAIPLGEGGFQRTSNIPTAPAVSMTAAAPLIPTECGSAAADWSRWPAGTVFRIVSTGQIYRVDDCGWALSGRNTIDLYMPTRRSMNAWGLRREGIEILQWGDPRESLRILKPREKYRHIRRMVLELEGDAKAAAKLQ